MEAEEGIRDPRGAGAEREVAVGRAGEEGEAEASRRHWGAQSRLFCLPQTLNNEEEPPEAPFSSSPHPPVPSPRVIPPASPPRAGVGLELDGDGQPPVSAPTPAILSRLPAVGMRAA